MSTKQIETPTTASSCPIGATWHSQWRRYTLDTVRETPRTLNEAGEESKGEQTRLTPAWEVGPGDPTVFSGRTPLTTYAHQHTDFIVRGHAIHVDLIRATGTGPGFGLQAALVFVDGIFQGRAWVFGCLGGGGNNFPARARIDEHSTVTVSYEPGTYGGTNLPHIWVSATTDSRGNGV